MKLYLSSHDRHGIAANLGELVGDNRRVAVIANSTDGESEGWRRTGVSSEILALARLGLLGEELDLRRFFSGAGDLAVELTGFGLVWARGGNAFLLSRAMRDSGMLELLPDLLRETDLAYGGYSAGAVVAGPTLHGIELVDDALELPPPYAGPIAWDGLGVVPYSIAPHFRSDHIEADKIERVVEYFELNEMPYRTLADLQSIIIDGDQEWLLDQRTIEEKEPFH
jgi:dipeptidase E